MLKRLLQYYQIFSDLSLDVVGGAFFSILLLPPCFAITVDCSWYIGVPACTWIVYLMDHLLDIHLNTRLNTSRHRLIKNHEKKIIGLIILLCALLMGLIYSNFNRLLITAGAIVAAMCLMYFIATRKQQLGKLTHHLNKELIVAIIYATGVYIVVGLSSQHNVTWLLYYLIFLALSYQNILLTSIAEMEEDLKHKQYSWAAQVGKKNAQLVFYAIAGLILLGVTASFLLELTYYQQLLSLTYLMMWAAHMIIAFYYKRNSSTAHLRYWNELVFWIPGLAYTVGILCCKQ